MVLILFALSPFLKPSPDGEGGPLAVDEVIRSPRSHYDDQIYNVKISSSVILRMPPSPSGEGYDGEGYDGEGLDAGITERKA